MKYLPQIAAVLLGLLFTLFGLMFLLNLMPAQEPPPEGTPIAHFMTAFATTGYMKFVKVLEVVGGILVAIPLTRRLGLVVLGPIMVNSFAFHVFIIGAGSLFVGTAMPLWVLTALFLYLMWHEREPFMRAVIAQKQPAN
jgi:putative oxidoreductase